MTAETTSADVKVKIETPEKIVEVEIPEKKAEEDVKASTDDNKAGEGNKGRYPRKFNKEYYEERRRAWEEAQKNKEVVEQNVKGTVKWYSVIGRYGFIERADNKVDVFVHQSVIAKSKVEKYFLRTLDNGEEVVFDIVQGRKGLEAANVTGPDGADVKGSKYYRVLLNKYRRNFRRRRFDGKKGDRNTSKKDSNEKDEAEKGEENGGDAKAKDGKKSTRPYRRRRFQRKSANRESTSAGKDQEQEAGGQRRRRRGSSNANKPASDNSNANVAETKLGGNSGDVASLGTSITVEAIVA